MKAKLSLNKGSRKAWSPFDLPIKSILISAFILTGLQMSLPAQDQKQTLLVTYTKPSWWFGIAGGANFNFYRGTTQELNSNLTVPAGFHHGQGVGLFLAPLVEFHRPDSKWGVMLQAGYDSRKGKFEETDTPCNCPADLETDLAYITVEPSVRVAPFNSNFYLFAGPRLGYNISNSFTYQLGINPAFPDQAATPKVEGDLDNMKKIQISMQIGAGYDIPLSSQERQTQFVLSPFASFHPYFGQFPRSIETWNVTTLRVGVALKFGRGQSNSLLEEKTAVEAVPEKTVVEVVPGKTAVLPEVRFVVFAPQNVPVERRVRETFPIRNYIFFDLKSTDIPDRYVLLKKNQVKDFKEDRLEVFTPKRLSGRSSRQMVAYYNVLNILGDRMGRFPDAKVRLTGASMDGIEDGIAMASTVKKYLVDVFGIDPSRITTEGRVKPRIASERPGRTDELLLLRQEDRRVSIFSDSPEMTMEYQTGPNVPLKPVEVVAVQEAPLDSYVTFDAIGAKAALTSWKLEISDKLGKTQKFGPYTEEKQSLPGKTVLGAQPQGDYKMTMIGANKIGNKTIKLDTTVHMVLWKPSEREEGMRFSVMFEFDESNAIGTYEKYLADIVTPKIPKGATVIIHGHTDVVGNEAVNKALSIARANEVKGILESALLKAGTTGVNFVVYGFGEDENEAPFENKYPEDRFYNRAVIIDIIPKKI